MTRRASIRGARRRRAILGWAFSVPALLAFLLFKYYPVVQTFYMSLYDYRVMHPPGVFMGMWNYFHAFKDPLMRVTWWNNLSLFFLGLLFGFWVPILQAMLLNEVRFGKRVLRVLYLLPAVMPSLSLYVIWKWFYNPDYGLLNALLAHIGLGPFKWLNNPHMAKPCLMLPGLLGGGLGIFIYLAAIQGIPQELFEAAAMDGAGPFQKLRYVLVPQIWPIIKIQFTLALAQAFQIFEQVFVMTGGGPVNSTRVVTLNIYLYGFWQLQFGYASAIAVLLMVITFVLVFIQLRVTPSEAR